MSPRTLISYRTDLRAYFAALRLIQKDPLQIKHEDLTDYLWTRKAKGIQASSLARYIASLRCYYRFLLADGLISKDPTAFLQSRRLFFVSLSLGIAACAPSKVFVSQTYLRPQRVAVLPMSNATNDLDGPVAVRQALFNHLTHRGFTLVPLAEIDSKLKEQGFTDGGQLKAATPQKIGAWIGADGLFYSTLEEFNYIILGYYTQRTVKIHSRLVKAETGENLWEADRGWATRAVAADKKDAEKQFAIQLAAKALEKMTHVPLQFETREAVYRLLNTLP